MKRVGNSVECRQKQQKCQLRQKFRLHGEIVKVNVNCTLSTTQHQRRYLDSSRAYHPGVDKPVVTSG
ncbi:hypothetical protein PoB_001883100 [Plakobranchus ocellatus]|uniref:Uncharacterized protein n=1 Tax=Plakobranchus ocellatus TaxID=259542 RepID=A0AAV3Z8T6_9GAST|nr:hypothetical protein PoB_001883100 [Plakobranchus ocellatus]